MTTSLTSSDNEAAKLSSCPLPCPISLQALGKWPSDQHLLLSLRVKELPTVTLQKKKATITIPASIRVLASAPPGTPETLFELNTVSVEGGQNFWGVSS